MFYLKIWLVGMIISWILIPIGARVEKKPLNLNHLSHWDALITSSVFWPITLCSWYYYTFIYKDHS